MALGYPVRHGYYSKTKQVGLRDKDEYLSSCRSRERGNPFGSGIN